mgnify:CR=1 FL=1
MKLLHNDTTQREQFESNILDLILYIYGELVTTRIETKEAIDKLSKTHGIPLFFGYFFHSKRVFCYDTVIYKRVCSLCSKKKPCIKHDGNNICEECYSFMTRGTPCICGNACLYCCGRSNFETPSTCQCHTEETLCYGCSTVIRLYKPIMDNRIRIKKKIVDETNSVEWSQLIWNAEIECFFTEQYENQKQLGGKRHKKRIHKGPRREEWLPIPNEPIMEVETVERLPIVKDKIFYHYTDGTIRKTVHWWLDINKVTQGGNIIHLQCEQCKQNNAVFDTNQGALCFCCDEKNNIEKSLHYEREMRKYKKNLRFACLPKLTKPKNLQKWERQERKKKSVYPKKFKNLSIKEDDSVFIHPKTHLRQSIMFIDKPKNIKKDVPVQNVPPYWCENNSIAGRLFSNEMGYNKQKYLEEFPELPIKECDICFTKTKEMINTPCNHLFCKDCLKKWITTKSFTKIERDEYGYEYSIVIQLNDNCPVCRHEFSKVFKRRFT